MLKKKKLKKILTVWKQFCLALGFFFLQKIVTKTTEIWSKTQKTIKTHIEELEI